MITVELASVAVELGVFEESFGTLVQLDRGDRLKTGCLNDNWWLGGRSISDNFRSGWLILRSSGGSCAMMVFRLVFLVWLRCASFLLLLTAACTLVVIMIMNSHLRNMRRSVVEVVEVMMEIIRVVFLLLRIARLGVNAFLVLRLLENIMRLFMMHVSVDIVVMDVKCRWAMRSAVVRALMMKRILWFRDRME